MAVTSSFYEAVAAGNLLRVRIMMKDSLLLDPTFRTFHDMEAAASGMPGLYEEHDGRAFNMDKSQWTDDYMNDVKVQVISNFSRERVEHLQDVIRYLRPAPVPPPRQHAAETQSGHSQAQQRPLNYGEQKRHDQQSGTYLGAKVAAGAVVGAAAGATVAAVASAAVAGGAAVGAVVGGTATYLLVKRSC